MRIGDFAKLCKTQISVLRHYDKIGLIKPDFTDKFTSYRYYDSNQAKDYEEIAKLKKLGFSLKDIRKLRDLKNSQETEKIFNNKISELETLILKIKQEKGNLCNLNRENKKMINMNDYNKIELKKAIDKIAFENDPEAVGKWEIIGEYDTKESFLSEITPPMEGMYGKKFKEIYFLPNGQRYWIYGWTKGYIINSNGDYTAVNPYKIEEINGGKYMFAEWKSYYYFREGKETVLVLKQADNKKYTKDEISRKDDIDKPFIDDKKILGKWKAVARVKDKEAYFNPDEPEPNLFFNSIEFKENGKFMRNGNDTSRYANWTKGYLQTNAGNGTEKTAEKYDFKTIDGKEYLFIEFKSGDYLWGGFDPTYYVFVRD